MQENLSGSNPVFAATILRSFVSWAEKDKLFEKSYDKLKDEAKEMIKASLSEIGELQPAAFEHWWLLNHMRFQKVPQMQQRPAYEMVRTFLCKHVRGELRDVRTKEKNRSPKGGKETS